MDKWAAYRILLRFRRPVSLPHTEAVPKDLLSVFRRYRVPGAAVSLFDESGVSSTFACGMARAKKPVTADTRFRIASVSKHITAMCAMKLWEDGRIGLDCDVSPYLGFTLRHPQAPDTPVTLRMLMTHTAGIHDGEDYIRAFSEDTPLDQLMKGDCFCPHKPGARWEYSNLGAGIAGSVLEGMTGRNFDTLIRETVFEPLGVEASYYPQRLGEPLADAYRILPRSRSPIYDAAERLSRPLPADRPDPLKHYTLAHGNLCISAPQLALLGCSLLAPGFLKASTLSEMRKSHALFGNRAPDLSQGIGTFILKNSAVCPRVLYGHQGLAYGAVHGIFYDPDTGRGFVCLTTAAGEARRGVLTDLNADLIRLLLA